MMKFILVGLLVLYVSLSEDNMVSSACCSSRVDKCGDCSLGTPCCGYGPCNIFCCNCDDGCRTGNCFQRDFLEAVGLEGSELTEYDVHHLVTLLDKNGDRLINLQETEEYFTNGRSAMDTTLVAKEFKAMDTNADGFLSFDEIDPSARTAATTTTSATP